MYWVNVFSKLTKQVSIHTDEKAMLASRTIRQMHPQNMTNHLIVRRADCLFMFDDIEISNIEFKRPSISEAEIGVQNRKYIRLGRCLQEGHSTFGTVGPSVLMADASGKQ
ncbi:hypothetical protein BCR41DRAFT_363475 [Lobosporangium transversale]|uniref:Uncharacterized protein n=1 Tax=Lobosporangium transversale TaxID=64571 RepID=A0A1Y2GA76_9FUNG|nr:hypothetical protein BCR41DRAFT_363475 [Lobosporangium transversale]ORZ01839.1 hypothetical protein BCR41DRAFT_363475 [Lobosporangium transversale]|eukprot:XP_021876136.1 hypothetical protein BCR41DRAFT_363475 [Lobosporangium transversale]